jgi:hypothetical protein
MRSSTLRVPPSGISRENAVSIAQYAGPSTARYSRLPNVPAAGAANAARFRKLFSVYGP